MPDLPKLPPIASQPLSVVLLAGSDPARVDEAAAPWLAWLRALGKEHEVLLVADSAEDRTAELAAQLPEVQVLRHAWRRGPGAALRLGIETARHPLLLLAPCSLAYDPADTKALLADIDRVDIVAGHRIGRPVPLGLRGLGL